MNWQTSNNHSFTNKVAIISGSSMGIGKATAIDLGLQGAKIVLNGVDKEKLVETEIELMSMGLEVISVVADIRFPQQCKNLVEKAFAAFGRIDILINNAAVSSRGSVEEMADTNYKILIETNFLGAAHLTKYAIPYIKETQGHIIFINSVGGFRGMPYNSAYTASKMAQAGLAEALRIEMYSAGVHVGIVYVGFTENDPRKIILDVDGSWTYLPKRTNEPLAKRSSVARSIRQLIETRTDRVILTRLGLIASVLIRYFPRLSEWILWRSQERIRQEFTYIGGDKVVERENQGYLNVSPVVLQSEKK